MRRLTMFPCEASQIVATLDEAAGNVGLLIVSGGNELRVGAHRGMTALAACLAARGTPVLRFDRRGVGDSDGENGGWRSSSPDIAAAVAALRREQPQVTAILGFGNCDAAAALAMFGRETGVDAVLLANPWLGDEPDALPPAAAIRARYLDRLRHPAEWWRLLTGGVNLSRIAAGLGKLAAPPPSPPIGERVLAGIAAWGSDAQVLLAAGDATAIGFRTSAAGRPITVETIDTASHSFAGRDAQDALAAAVFRAVARLEARLA